MQMYKIFFKERVVFLTREVAPLMSIDFDAVLKYGNQGELKDFINRFDADKRLKTAIIYHHNAYDLLQNFRACFVNLPAAGGLVWNGERSLFLGMKRRGCFDLPKGKVERDETFEEAAIREVEEECGIIGVQPSKFLVSTYHTYKIGNKHIFKETRWYDMFYLGNELPTPQTTEDIESVFWIDPGDVDTVQGQTYSSILEVMKAGGIICK
ncbi:NUDIX hydrolase [Natronoflexus pectinivorans]|nr:NUDIX domain-containing protein [Natronoflexus pectinivorans]